MTKLAGLLIAWTLLQVPCAAAQTRRLAPTYWNQRLLFIPYQVNQGGKLPLGSTKVQLLYSRTGLNDWSMLNEAEPNVQGFSFHAPEDGEYWFALRHLDHRGQPRPTAAVQPQMRLVVDTVMPMLTLEGSSMRVVNWSFATKHETPICRPTACWIELLGSGDTWLPVQLGKPDIDQVDRLLGRVRLPAPVNRSSIKIRATIADKAGQREFAETVVATRPLPALLKPLKALRWEARRLGPTPSPTRSGERSSYPPTTGQPVIVCLQENTAASNRSQTSAPGEYIPIALPSQAWPSRTPAKLVGDGSTSEPSLRPLHSTRQQSHSGSMTLPPSVSKTRSPGTLRRLPDAGRRPPRIDPLRHHRQPPPWGRPARRSETDGHSATRR